MEAEAVNADSVYQKSRRETAIEGEEKLFGIFAVLLLYIFAVQCTHIKFNYWLLAVKVPNEWSTVHRIHIDKAHDDWDTVVVDKLIIVYERQLKLYELYRSACKCHSLTFDDKNVWLRWLRGGLRQQIT